MDGLQASVEKMRREGLPEPAIATFEHYYRQLAEGETGMIPESEIEPVEDPQELDELPEGDAALDEAVVAQAQRRARHEHGHDAREVADRGQGRH